MDIEQIIKEKITQSFSPLVCEVVNDSARHKGHAGDDGSGQTHFKLEVVSPAFEGMTRIQRHRAVKSALETLFDVGLHALSMKLYSEKEYKN